MTEKSELLSLFRTMLRIRRVEERLADRYNEEQMRSPMHLCIGQEAVAAGVSYWLDNADHAFSGHRAHGHYLAKGGDLNRMIAELLGKRSGCCAGRGGSMHLIDQSAGFIGSTPIVGGTVPLAAGSAWAAKLKSEPRVTIVYFGDGCFEEGVMHEALNFAVLQQLPIVFVCENNGYSGYTNLQQRQPDKREIHTVAEAHGLAAFVGDGNDVLQVSTLAQYAIAQAREQQGPQFLEFHTHRWREHSGPHFDDDLGYREEGELEYWLQRCPVLLAKRQLLENGTVTETDIETIEQSLDSEIKAAFEFALQSDAPSNGELEESIYAA
jgi:TPP-dependent pyruvate/acetoin dehydrogenase alpha subunit